MNYHKFLKSMTTKLVNFSTDKFLINLISKLFFAYLNESKIDFFLSL